MNDPCDRDFELSDLDMVRETSSLYRLDLQRMNQISEIDAESQSGHWKSFNDLYDLDRWPYDLKMVRDTSFRHGLYLYYI